MIVIPLKLEVTLVLCHDTFLSKATGLLKNKKGKNKLLTSYEFLSTYLRARFGDDERGASLVEYALLVALIAVVCIAAVSFLGEGADSKNSSTGK